MQTPKNPVGPVLTIQTVSEEDRRKIVESLGSALDIELVVDGEHYPLRTVARFQFAAPEYRRK